VVEVLMARADGLPFLVEELLAAMVQGHELRSTADGWVLDRSPVGGIPATFAETVRRRLETAPGTRDLLMAAALLGRSFDWRLLLDMSGQDEGAAVERLHRATDAQLLSMEGTDHGPRFRFRHALTRDAILAELLPPERATLAARGLRAVEAAHRGLPGEWCELAAELAEEAGDLARAAALHLESGRRAFGRGALPSSEANLERARRLAGDNDRQLAVEIDEALCEVLVAAGHAERVGEVGQRLLSQLADLGGLPTRRARVRLWLARMAIVSADWATARDQLDRAGELVPGGVAAGELDVLAAQVALGEGRLEDAVTLANSALVTAEAAGRYENRLRCP
jgi:hypothetical protein